MKDSDSVIFAIERERSTRSMAYVGLINKFGARDLFEKILVRLQDQESSLEFVYYIVAALVAAAPNFHKSFIDHYLNRLKDAVEQHIITAEEKKVRLMKTRTNGRARAKFVGQTYGASVPLFHDPSAEEYFHAKHRRHVYEAKFPRETNRGSQAGRRCLQVGNERVDHSDDHLHE